MKLILMRDWDIQISPPSKEKENIRGHYGGRDKEVEILANEILRGKKGSILISGYRGVGKTSLVYKSLWDVKEKDENITFILINAAQLEIEVGPDSKEIDPRKIIENLIRRLYSTTHEDKSLNSHIHDQINSLYRRAIASDFRKIEGTHYQRDISKETTSETKIEYIVNDRNLIFIFSWTLATVLQVMPITPYDWINKLAPLLLAFPVPFSANILYEKYSKSSHSEIEKDTTEELYNFDNNLGNLEFDLEKLHRTITNSGKKLIYVIDELDKLDIRHIDKILNYFKNFFTLSDAIFIFIGGEEIFNIDSTNTGKANANLYRNKNYTYFTSKYFIPRPLWPDLRGFIDGIIDEIEEGSADQIETLERALCFDSKNDFYDIKKYIKDRITGFDDQNRPIIELTLSDKDIKKARFHKIITILFEEKYKIEGHSRWSDNENLIKALFIHANVIYSSYDGSTFENPFGDDSESEIVRDFNAFLYRLGAFQLEGRKQVHPTTPPKTENQPYLVQIYKYIGDIPNSPPPHLNEATEFERRFINNFIEYARYSLSIINALKKAIGEDELDDEDLLNLSNDSKRELLRTLGDDYLNVINTYCNDYMTLTSQANLYKKSREETEKIINNLMSQTDALKRALHLRIKNIILYLYPDTHKQYKTLKDNKMYFSFLSDHQRSALRDSHVLTNQDLSKQLMFIDNYTYLSQIAEEVADTSSTHRVIMLTDSVKRDTKLKGVHIVVTESPEVLNKSLNELLDDLKTFWSNDDENVAET